MYALVAVKYRDPTLRKRLLDTRESELKEWVKSREGYWSALTYSGQSGQNMLGHILMRVREFIRLHKTPPTAKRWPDVTRDDHKTGEQSTAKRRLDVTRDDHKTGEQSTARYQTSSTQ